MREVKSTSFALMTPTYLRAPERIGLVRVAAADVVLEDEELADWTVRTVANTDKKRRFALPVAQAVGTHDGWLLRGRPRDPRRYAAGLLGHKILKKPPASIELRVWQDLEINKIFLLDSELRQANDHVVGDLLDSLESH